MSFIVINKKVLKIKMKLVAALNLISNYPAVVQ